MQDTRIQELEAKVAELTAMVERLAPQAAQVREDSPLPVATDPAPVVEEAGASTSSRRRMLRNVALAAGGAVAVTVGSNVLPAAAAHEPTDIGVGLVNVGGTGGTLGTQNGKTTLNYVAPAGNTTGVALLVQTGTVFGTDDADFPAAVGAWATDPNHPTGLYAFTSATGDNQAVAAIGVGTRSLGLRVTGNRAAALFNPTGTAGPLRTDAHVVGELIEDTTGNLWLNVVAGTPGIWRKLAGPATAGAFHPISQVRVYDSRAAQQANRGKIATGGNRVVSVANSIVPSTGVANTDNIVPAGATAVTGNITVTDTTGALGGFLTIMPGDAAALIGSSVNWFGPDQNIANSFIAKLDTNRQLKIFAGGAPTPDTDFILDITGYYL